MKNKASNVSSKRPRAAKLQTTREKKLDADRVLVSGSPSRVSRVTAQPGCDRSLGLVQLIVESIQRKP